MHDGRIETGDVRGGSRVDIPEVREEGRGEHAMPLCRLGNIKQYYTRVQYTEAFFVRTV